MASHNKHIDITGNTYARLTVIRRAENNGSGYIRYLCECRCGNQKVVLAKHLRSGKIRSCGCLRDEISSKKVVNGKRVDHVRTDGIPWPVSMI